MIKTIIIDDEPLARAMVREFLQHYPMMHIVAECGDGFEGLKAIQQHQPGLVFLDVQMPKISGFEMLELIDDPLNVIFTTAFDTYAVRAFDAHAIDYLLKPFSKERFDQAIQKWMEHSQKGDSARDMQMLAEAIPYSATYQYRIVLKTAGKIKIIPVQEVHYLEAADDYVKLVTNEGSFLKTRTMSYFAASLDPQQFVRTHRSFIVNVQLITRIDPYEKDGHVAILKTGAKVPVSKSGYVRLRQVLGL